MEYILKNKRCQGKLYNKAVGNKGGMRGGEICHLEKKTLAVSLYPYQEKSRNNVLPVLLPIGPFQQNPRFPTNSTRTMFSLLVPRFS